MDNEKEAHKQTITLPVETSPVEQLLNRQPPQDYIREWEAIISREKTKVQPLIYGALVIFRLGTEFLALSSSIVGQITNQRKIHRIPHIRNPIICGVVSVNGRLRLFFSMEKVLEMNRGHQEKTADDYEFQPMILIDYEEDVWAFGIAEVLGVFHCDLSQMKNVPVTVIKSTSNYVKGVLRWRDKEVAVLDEQLLMFRLRRCL